MDSAALNALLCPHCGLDFTSLEPGTLRCADGHSFDIARQGYVNLLTGHGTKFLPDTADMVAARDSFLEAGHYNALAEALADTVRHKLSAHPLSGQPALVVDAGTGTGWYLQRVLAGLANNAGRSPIDAAAIALDISKFALRRAARRNPQAANVVWDLWRDLPLGAGTADVVLVVFAPRNAAEFARILKPGGTLVVVTPLPGHLGEIAHDAGMLGIQAGKEEALSHSFAGYFAQEDTRELQVDLKLSPSDIGNVALMGPAGHHADVSALKLRLAEFPEVTPVTAAFRITTFRHVQLP